MNNQRKQVATAILFIGLVLGGFLTSCDDVLEKYGTNTSTELGDTLWVHTLEYDSPEIWIVASPLAIGSDGSIYYSAGGGMATWEADRIYAINPKDGSLKWKSEALETWHLNSNIMVGDDGNIYVESYTKLYSIDPGSGSINWIWEVPETLPYNDNDVYTYGELGGLALADNGDIITKTNGSGIYYRALYCIGTNGEMKWHRFIGAEITPISIGNQGTIYDFNHSADYQNAISATNPLTGNVMWSFPVQSALSANNNIVFGNNGGIIAMTAGDSLTSINPVDHNILWKSPVNSPNAFKVIDPEGSIFLFNQFVGTYLFNSETGNQIGDPVKIPHYPAIDSKGHLLGIINENYPNLSVTDKTGTVQWENKMDNFNGGNCIAISDDKVVYVSNSKKVYAIQGNAALPKSGWPRFSHDNRNTFNFSKW